MEKLDMVRQTVGNAVRSLYQMIMTVDEETFECHVIDYNKELRNISEDCTDPQKLDLKNLTNGGRYFYGKI